MELEPIEEITKVVNRLAPPTPRGLASKFTENEINEIIEKRNIEVLAGHAASEVLGNPST